MTFKLIYPSHTYSEALTISGLERLAVRRENITKKLFIQISDERHVLHNLLPKRIASSTISMRNSCPYHIPITKATRYGRAFIPYCISKRYQQFVPFAVLVIPFFSWFMLSNSFIQFVNKLQAYVQTLFTHFIVLMYRCMTVLVCIFVWLYIYDVLFAPSSVNCTLPQAYNRVFILSRCYRSFVQLSLSGFIQRSQVVHLSCFFNRVCFVF